MGDDGVAEELEHALALQLEGLCYGQDPLDKTKAFFTVAAEGDFPPQDQASQDPLGQVVGWFHPLPADECPQRLLEPQHICTELGGLPLGTRQPLPQQAAEPSFQRMHPAAQLSFTTHLWQRTPAPLAGLGIMMNDIQQLARRKSGGRMVQPPRLATGLPACTLLRTGRIRRGRYGGIAGFLAQLLLEVLDPFFHLLQLGDQFLDQFIRTLNISREFGP